MALKSEEKYVAGIFEPGKSKARLWTFLFDGQRRTREDAIKCLGNPERGPKLFREAPRTLKKNGPPGGASHRARSKEYDWEIVEEKDAIQMINLRRL